MARAVCETITPFIVMQVLERAAELEAQGHRVIHLEIGQPDFKTPECVDEAARAAIKDGKTGYTHSLGIPPLRRAIAEYYQEQYGVAVEPERVMVTGGSSAAMLLLFSALCEAGESVLISDPAYACYGSFIRFAGAHPLAVRTTEEAGFQLAPDQVEAALEPKTRAILVNSPSNPGGTLLGRGAYEKLAKLGPTLVSDEIYHGLVYEGEAVSALEVDATACVLDGFSKRWAMTGWRLGWMVVPQELIPTLQTLQQNFFICPGSVAQWAGIAALRHGRADMERMRLEYNRRRLVLLAGLRRLGFTIASEPAGAFYVLANAAHISPDSLGLAFDILEKAHVGVAPGIDFGPGAEGYLRFSYANSVENIEEALARLEAYLAAR